MAGGLKITPNHPIFINNSWVKPKDLPEAKLISNIQKCNQVYNLVMEPAKNIVEINGI